MEVPALFVPDGTGLLPTDAARGPWSVDALHGSPVAALVVRSMEQELTGAPGPAPMRVARLTLELLRPVPVRPLQVRTRTVRPGRRVVLVETEVEADGTTVARALGLALRVEAVDLPAAPESGPPPPPPGAGRVGPPAAPSDADLGWPWAGYHTDGVEIRYLSGHLMEPGPAAAWFRLRLPVVPGEAPSPAVRAAAVADFANGISGVLPFETFVFVNPDLTVYLNRPPEGEWVLVDAVTDLTTAASTGSALATSVLSDRAGPFGTGAQSLFVARR